MKECCGVCDCLTVKDDDQLQVPKLNFALYTSTKSNPDNGRSFLIHVLFVDAFHFFVIPQRWFQENLPPVISIFLLVSVSSSMYTLTKGQCLLRTLIPSSQMSGTWSRGTSLGSKQIPIR
jgi:hypothetical protein